MPAQWEEEFCWDQEDLNINSKGKKDSVPLRPPLYNAEDYIEALKLLFSSHHSHKSNYFQFEPPQSQCPSKSRPNSSDPPKTPPEMSMRKFLNGSELLFKLEADLEHAYPSFVQEFISVHCEGVLHTLEALKLIQGTLDIVGGLREQRKLLMDQQKCLQCLRLCLRNIEAVSKLSTYPGGLYPIAAATVSTVTATRIIALEILTCICSEGGAEGHFKISEAISTLRLRMGEPIRCKLLIGAISSAPPGTFQAKGIRFLTSWVSSAVSPKHKVHIQCELEEAGFNPAVLRKGAELGGGRESRQVLAELDAWNRVSIDVDTLTRQNSQLRNSVATLQQELATLKDKIKRMDVHPKPSEEMRRRSRKRSEELATTPADSEEEAEQIHQLLEDLNNIVNSELKGDRKCEDETKRKALETDIVPIHLVKSPPPKKGIKGPMTQIPVKTRPWPGSSASDEDEDEDSDLVQTPSPKLNPKGEKVQGQLKSVKKLVQEIDDGGTSSNSKPLYTKNGKFRSQIPLTESKPLNFHKQNDIANKFANFRSSKLHCSSPDNRGTERTPRFSPVLDQSEKRKNFGIPLRRSESLHTSLAPIPSSETKIPGKSKLLDGIGRKNGKGEIVDKWKSVDNLDNFTLRWKYPSPDRMDVKTYGENEQKGVKSKLKSGKGKSPGASQPNSGGVLEMFNDYRQNRFNKNSSKASARSGSGNGPTSSIFTKYSTKSSHSVSVKRNLEEVKEKESPFQLSSLPPIFVSGGRDMTNHRISDLPSGLY